MELGYLLKSRHRNAKIGFIAIICFLITQFISGIPFYLEFTFYSKPINIVELIVMISMYIIMLIISIIIMFVTGVLIAKYFYLIPISKMPELNMMNIIKFILPIMLFVSLLELIGKKLSIFILIAEIGGIGLPLLYFILLGYISKSVTKDKSMRLLIFGLFILASGLSFIFYFLLSAEFIHVAQ